MLREIHFQLYKETARALQGRIEPLLTDLEARGVRVSGLLGGGEDTGGAERKRCGEGTGGAEQKRCGEGTGGAEQKRCGEGTGSAEQKRCGEDTENAERRRCGEGTDSAEQKEGIMYLTDQSAVYAALREKGRYVLPCLHADNRSESFPGALYAVEQLEELDYMSFDLAYRRLAGLPWEILATERCTVRETTVEDVDSFYRIYGEPSITEYMENLFADRDEEISYTKDYIEKVYAFYGYGMWTVLESESGEVIGRAGISWREGYDLPELGFVFGVPWQGRGYAYEVCGAILDYAREELLMERVQSLVRPGNERSLRLCEKLGFVRRGETRLDGKAHLLLVKEL